VNSERDLDYLLGEWHVHAAKDSEVVVVLEDSLALSRVKDVPAMAMKAGKGTGNKARVGSDGREGAEVRDQ
jgi:hypothetical protein